MADLQTLDTASLGSLTWNGADGLPVLTDLVGVRNDRSGRVVGAFSKAYHLRQAPDLADLTLQAFEGAGGRFGHADFWANDKQHYFGVFGRDSVPQVGTGPKDTSPLQGGFGARNSFDGSLPVLAGGIAYRPACENAMQMAFRLAEQDGSVVRAKHNSKAQARLDETLLAYATQARQEVLELGNRLQTARTVVVPPLEVGNRLRSVFGPRTADQVLKVVPRYVNGLTLTDGQVRDASATDGATAWSLYQAATDHLTHHDGASSQQARSALLVKALELLV